MKHPRMRASARIAATVPALDGGIFASTDPTLIGDRQAAQARNLRFIDGALRTRRGWHTAPIRNSAWALAHTSRFFVDRDGMMLCVSWGDTEAFGTLLLTAFDANGVPTGMLQSLDGPLGLCGFLTDPGNSEALTPYTALLILSDGRLFGVHAKYHRFDELTDQAYVPLYRMGGTPSADRGDNTVTGHRAEPYNMLSERFRCQFSTDGRGIYYYLPPCRTDADIRITWTAEGRQTTWAIGQTHNGYTAVLDAAARCVWFEKNGVPTALVGDVRGDVEVTVYRCDVLPTHIGLMRHGTWYGGDHRVSGTRLFLGGENGYVMWSAVGDPLYFPSTCYAQVGDPHEAVTAFGKQGEYLLVFKERSLFAAGYQQQTAVTAEQLESGEAVDATATAQIPIFSIHAEIGCDLPDTVALCGNRLTWACRNGTVYTLAAVGALSERQVKVISTPIRALLRQNGVTHAAAVSHDGTYRLLWDTLLFTATDETVPRWWCDALDSLNASPLGLCMVHGEERLAVAYNVGGSHTLFWYAEGGSADSALSHEGDNWSNAVYRVHDVPVTATCTTKPFDFGSPDRQKRITRIFADVTAQSAVQASYVTEHGTYDDLPRYAHDGVRLTTSVARCRRLALRLTGVGLRVGSITFHVKEEQGWQN